MEKYTFPVTVFTPTYNRASLLGRLYESLKEQSCKSFEWIIYDDGSMDNTRSIVELFIREEKVNIKYVYQSNKGKHIAINRGVEIARGELFFIVDSDDYLKKDAIELIIEARDSININSGMLYAGVGGRRLNLGSKSSEFKFACNDKYCDSDSIEFAFKLGNFQDKAEVFFTNILSKYKFPEFKNENFITEVIVWYKIAQDGYKIRWFNEDIYMCEYLDDGLSRNYYRKRCDNIIGTCYSYNKLSAYNLPFKYKIRYKINYFRYGLNKFNIKYLIKGLEEKEYIVITMSIGFFLYIIDQIKSTI